MPTTLVRRHSFGVAFAYASVRPKFVVIAGLPKKPRDSHFSLASRDTQRALLLTACWPHRCRLSLCTSKRACLDAHGYAYSLPDFLPFRSH